MKRNLCGILPAMVLIGLVMAAVGPAWAKDYIYVPLSNHLQIIDCETDTVVKTIPYNDYIVQAAYSPDGKRYYLNTFHSVYVIDTTKNELVDTLNFSTDLSRVTVFGMAVSPDGSKLYLSCSITKKKQNIPKLNVLPPQLVVYDIEKEQIVNNYQIPYCVTGVITLRNDPDHLILFGYDIFKFDLENGEMEKVEGILHPEEGEEPRNSLVIWHNGSPGDHGIFTNPFYTATGMGYFVIDRNTGEVRVLEGEDVWFEYSTIVSPDKKHMFAVMDELIKIDLATGKTVNAVPVAEGTCYALSMTSDGKKIYVGPAGDDLSVYDTETLELKNVIDLKADGVVAHRISH